jgi:fructose-1,6-bisphosphatase/inositol monophosphatase family enzyme
VQNELLQLAKAATTAVSDLAGASDNVGTGYSGDPTSRIDAVAEAAILQEVDALDLPVNVLTEEKGEIDRGHEDVLVVDPIDGTVNAVRGMSVHGVSLAVGRENLSGLTHALVHDPVRDDTYYAEKGKGANLNGEPIRTRSLGDGSTLFLVYIGERAHPDSYKVAAAARRSRALAAASIELCLVAKGAANLYYFNSEIRARLRIVDMAAGILIVREAGGVVVGLDRKPLEVPLSTAARTNLIAAGDEAVLEALP